MGISKKKNMQHAHKNGLIKYVNGERHGMSKLNNNDVFQIRRMIAKGITQKNIADIYGINQSVVSCIKLKKAWGSI